MSDLPPLQIEPIKVPKSRGAGPGSGGDGWFFPFWFNGDGGFQEHKQLNWTNLFLLKKFGSLEESSSNNSNNTGGGCNYGSSTTNETQQHYKTGVYKINDFTFFGQTFKHDCHTKICSNHCFHHDLNPVGNTTNDILLTHTDILRALCQKFEEFYKKNPAGCSEDQADLSKQTEEIRNIVKRATRYLEDQNREILEKLSIIRSEVEKATKPSEQKFENLEKVFRDCLDDIEYKIHKLEEYQRKILDEVRKNGSSKNELQNLVEENNRILLNLQENNKNIEKLATKEKQEEIINKIQNIRLINQI